MRSKMEVYSKDWRLLTPPPLPMVNRKAPRAYVGILGLAAGQTMFWFMQQPITTGKAIVFSWAYGGFYGFMSGIWPQRFNVRHAHGATASGIRFIGAIFGWHMVRRMLRPYKHAGHHSPM